MLPDEIHTTAAHQHAPEADRPSPAAFRTIPWLNALSVGHADIDREHRDILAGANRVCALTAERAPPRVVIAAMSALLNELDRHFATEEELFTLLAFPEAEEHRAAHRHLRRDVKATLQAFATTSIRDDAVVTCRALVLAIVEHIIRHDSRYKTFVLCHQGR